MTGFRDIAAQLRGAIERGEYPPGSRIPTEHTLAEQYGVSRETVRRALAELKAAGLLATATSRGTYVPDPPVRLAVSRYRATVDPGRPRSDLGPWETACAEQGIEGRGEVVSVRRERASATLAARLDVPAGASVVHRSRRMWAGGEVAQLQDSWMPLDLVGGTPLAGRSKVIGGVYAAMVAAGIVPASVSEEVSARPATAAERDRMGLGEAGVVLDVWRATRDSRGRTVEVLHTVADARRSTFSYEDLPIRETP